MSGTNRSGDAQPTPHDVQDLLILARALRDRGSRLLARPGSLRARARAQHIALSANATTAQLDPDRRDGAQTELLATLSALRRATDTVAVLGSRVEEVNGEIDELLAMAGPAASPVRMLLSRRCARDTAQVAAGHLRRFMLSLSTVRFAVELRHRAADLDAWQPDARWLWQDYKAHTTSYRALLAGLAEPERQLNAHQGPGSIRLPGR
ncbi:MAG: hypothetical protein ACRDSP_07275 [Pseudonocardiaceae bacterium]